MRILVAPDSFKGSLTSTEACSAMLEGIRSVMPDADIIRMPLADGGEGTLAIVQGACGGDVRDEVLYLDDSRYVLIESAAFIGWTLSTMQVDVFERGSAALDQALWAALDAGVQDIRIALGGSATVDGGLGLLLALGCKAWNDSGSPVSADLNGLVQVHRISVEGLDKRLNDVQITLLSDVQNSLCGCDGAVFMFGEQKGMASSQLLLVDAAMQHWADVCEQSFAVSVQANAATGAAGGVGFALQLLGAKVVSGAEYVMQVSGFDQVVNTVDWVLTGEGCSDTQTLQGKLPWMVAQKARQSAVSVALISGNILNAEDLAHGFDAMIAAKPEDVSVADAMLQAEAYLMQAAARWAESVV